MAIADTRNGRAIVDLAQRVADLSGFGGDAYPLREHPIEPGEVARTIADQLVDMEECEFPNGGSSAAITARYAAIVEWHMRILARAIEAQCAEQIARLERERDRLQARLSLYERTPRERADAERARLARLAASAPKVKP